MKQITTGEVIGNADILLGNLYMMVRVYPETTVEDLEKAESFWIIEDKEKQEQEKKEKPVPKKKPANKKPANAVDLDFDEVKQLRDEGWTYVALGKKYGCSDVTIINFLRREGKKRAEEGTKNTNGNQNKQS